MQKVTQRYIFGFNDTKLFSSIGTNITNLLIIKKNIIFCCLIKKYFSRFFLFFHKTLADSRISITFAPVNDGAIAQSVEQRTENPCVPGSIPGGTTFKIANNLIYRLLAFFYLTEFRRVSYKVTYDRIILCVLNDAEPNSINRN